MKIDELSKIEGFKKLADNSASGKEFGSVYISDLLSVVLSKAEHGCLWITAQSHKNIVGVASVKEISAILIVEGFMPDGDTITKAREENIEIFTTELSAFESVKLILKKNGDL
ncbi:MAG: DRTGG domain protein [Elusimicrobia bacterium ADurb.Bin231]|nr:MAG: DRTGG domain protein [Elusimicrobia bacterium ADurb.Bin231]